MTVTVQIPSVLRSYCGGAAEFSLPANSVRDALEQIERNHPSLYVNVCDETGSLRRHVNVFVNSSIVHHDTGLDTALVAGDVLSIFQAVSGG